MADFRVPPAGWWSIDAPGIAWRRPPEWVASLTLVPGFHECDTLRVSPYEIVRIRHQIRGWQSGGIVPNDESLPPVIYGRKIIADDDVPDGVVRIIPVATP